MFSVCSKLYRITKNSYVPDSEFKFVREQNHIQIVPLHTHKHTCIHTHTYTHPYIWGGTEKEKEKEGENIKFTEHDVGLMYSVYTKRKLKVIIRKLLPHL